MEVYLRNWVSQLEFKYKFHGKNMIYVSLHIYIVFISRKQILYFLKSTSQNMRAKTQSVDYFAYKIEKLAEKKVRESPMNSRRQNPLKKLRNFHPFFVPN
ncbi:hypothetical protein Avbf_12846 [Armadillidium vulgare]|nr:hypothetical protein Avbf_12846 [Armadillidium vulgare]